MITRVIVPDVGTTGGDVRVAEWLVKEGDRIETGQPLLSLETDKAIHEIEAFRGGYLRKLLVPVDAEVEIGAVLALMTDTLDEPLSETTKVDAEAVEQTFVSAASGKNACPTSTQKPGRILASPLARRLAEQHGLDLAAVTGSGPQGQVHKRDILPLIAAAAQPSSGRRVPLSSMRRAIARRTQLSKSEIPHFYAGVTIDATDAIALRERLVEQARASERPAPTLNDFILLASARALRQVPELNASFQGEEILYFDEAAIGVAMAVGDGVLVPVIPAAERHSLQSLAEATAALRARAGAGRLTADDLAGGALTVSNLGMHGVDRFTAVINPPQVAVLAVGSARTQAAVYQGKLAIRTLVEVNLSIDHRVADGLVAARFLKELRRLLETPDLLLNKDLS